MNVRTYWEQFPPAVDFERFPEAAWLRDRILVLPVHQGLTAEGVEWLARLLPTLRQNGHDMRRSLIVNADELGLTEGINEGIVEVHARGIVTSTTMVANFWAFDHAVAALAEVP